MKFLELIKKNLALVSVLVLSLAVSGILLFFALQKYALIRDYQKALTGNIAKILEKVQGISPTNPGPVKENVESIKADTLKIKKKVDEIHLIFGMPYRKAFQAFAKELGEDELTLLSKWRELFRREIRKNNLAKQVLVDQLAKYDPEKVNVAKTAFTDVLKAESVEPLDDLDDYILDSIGVPRNMTPEDSRRYIMHMSEKLQVLLSNDKIGKGITIKAPATNSFIIYDKLPLPSLIPYIVKNYKLIEDLLFRLKKAGVTNLVSLSKVTPLDGYVDKGYLYFNYKISLSGTMSAIREFVNLLQNSHLDNRVYIIKNIKLEKAFDEVTKITAVATAPVEAVKNPGADSNPFRDNAVKNDAVSLIPVDSKLVMGGMDTNIINAEIDVDYVTYIEDEIKK